MPSPKSLLVETSGGREEGREEGEIGLGCRMVLLVGVLIASGDRPVCLHLPLGL